MALCCFAERVAGARGGRASGSSSAGTTSRAPSWSSTQPGNGGNMLLPYFVPEITPRLPAPAPSAGSGRPTSWRAGTPAAAARAVVEAQALSMRLHSAFIGQPPGPHPGHGRRVEEPRHPAGAGRRLPGRDRAAAGRRTRRRWAAPCGPPRPSRAGPGTTSTPVSPPPTWTAASRPIRRSKVTYEGLISAASRRDSNDAAGRNRPQHDRKRRMSKPAFPGIEPIRYQPDAPATPWRSGTTTRTRRSAASAWKTTCAWRSATGTRSCGTASTCSAPARSTAPGTATATPSSWRKEKAAAAFELFEQAGRPVLLLPRPRRRARGRTLAETNDILDTIADVLAAQHEEDGRQAAVGNGEPVLAPALHGRAPRPTPIPRCSPSPPRR